MTSTNNNLTRVFSCYLVLQFFFFIFPLHAQDQVGTSSNKTYPDKFKIQLGSYFIRDTNTEVGINSTVGNIGTTIELERDLGTDDTASIPRINGYYRFNNKHRIEYSWYEVDRKGTKTTSIEFTVDGEVFAASSLVETEIKSKFYEIDYAYSFYRSPEVELSFMAGLNIIDYSVRLNNKTSGKNEMAEVTAPLPVFGLLMDYNITPRWLVHFRFETFYIEINDKIRGSLINGELGTEYRLLKNVGLGIGLNRYTVDAKIKSSKYTGKITDIYRGINIYAAAYF